MKPFCLTILSEGFVHADAENVGDLGRFHRFGAQRFTVALLSLEDSISML